MEKDQVLGLFFSTFESLYKQRKQIHESFQEEEKNYDLEKLTISSKNILRLLLENKCLNQRTIAKNTDISSQAVGQIVKKLESMDLIQKKAGLINNEILIELSPLGYEYAFVLDRNIKTHAKEAFDNMTEEELQTFYQLLKKIKV